MSASRNQTELLHQAIAGDPVALQRLLLLEQANLVARIRRRLPVSLATVVGVEDILQETYTQVFRNISRFVPHAPGDFGQWVTTIADNSVRSSLRAHQAAKRGGGWKALGPQPNEQSSLLPLLEALTVCSRTPSMSFGGHEAVLAVENALAQIHPEYRQALTLRYLQGLSIAEVAARMGKTESAVHKICARALVKLKDQLGDSCNFYFR